jgi:DNA-directed RNA polymerase specialized sigma24 family protein
MIMEYQDQTLVDHIHGRLDRDRAAEVGAKLAEDSVGGALHGRYLSLQIYEAVRSLRSYARHLCHETRSPSPDVDADDLVVNVFEKILEHCKKPQSFALRLRTEGSQLCDGTGQFLPKSEIRPLQCRLQVFEIENDTPNMIAIEIDGSASEIAVPQGSENSVRIARRFFEPGSHLIHSSRGEAKIEEATVSVVPLKRILRKTIKNASSDLYLRKLTPKEQKLTGSGDPQEEKPRYVSRGDNFESLDVAVGEDDEVSVEETLLSQQQVDAMREQVTTNIEFRSEAPRILAFIQSDGMNSDFREALLLFLNGSSYSEIAEHADVSEGTARSRVCKARMALAKAFPDLHEQLRSRARKKQSGV